MEVIEHIVLENGDVMATNTEEHPDKVVPHSQGRSVMKSDRLVAEMPALSWHVIRMKRR
jgi:alpha-N-arabinofuranosidase